jgi:PAS domain S-box-containing protein
LTVSADLSRTIVASLEDVLTLRDRQGRFVFVGPSVLRLTGFPPERLLGTPEGDLIHPDDRDRVEQSATAYFRGDPAGEIEFRCRTHEGPYRRVAARGQLLRDAHGRPLGVLRCLRDLTERMDQEERTGQARKLEAVGRLAAGVAHDFNNLLTIITGYTCVLLEGHAAGDPDHEMLRQIERASERIAALVGQLLAFGGRQMLNLSRVDLNAVILHLTEVFKHLLGPDIHLHLNLAPSLRPVLVDRARIEQALLDLAANARDAMPAGGRFSLTTTELTGESPSLSPTIRLTVADTGPSMSEHVLAHVFEPFFTAWEAARGSGIRLASVYGTVRQCGGQITATSRPGEGTTFTVTFPAATPATREESTRGGRFAAHGPRTILLVEDEHAVRRLARQVLQEQGYTVLEACDGEEALQVYAEHAGPIDLLVTDVVMPHRTGTELARRLLEQAPGLRILFISGHDRDDDDLGEFLDRRRAHFLAKPFLPDDLARVVREILHADET